MGRKTFVSLTSARFHYKTTGIDAARMLLSAINRNDSVLRIMKLDFEIMERESTNKK